MSNGIQKKHTGEQDESERNAGEIMMAGGSTETNEFYFHSDFHGTSRNSL